MLYDKKFIKYVNFSYRYIVSDRDSIEVLVHGHKWLGDSKEVAVAHVLKAGTALTDYVPFNVCFYTLLCYTSNFSLPQISCVGLDLGCGDYYISQLHNASS